MNRYLPIAVTILFLWGCAKEPPKVANPPAPQPTSPPPTPTASAADVKAAQSLRQLGLQERSQGRLTEALAALKESVNLDPQNLDGRVLLGWTFHLAGQEEAASQSLGKALEQDSTHVPALNALGIVQLVEGDLAAAVATHTKAAALQPNNEIAYYNLSLAYHRLQDYEQAIAQGNQAVALEPSNPHPLVALAIAYWDQGNQSKAQQTYQQAIALDSRYRSGEFLAHLDQAGWSAEQIQTAKQVLEALS